MRPVNFRFLIHEAKKRRLQQRFIQPRLAKIAGVSTPTLSRLENEKNVTVDSFLRIFSVLGLSHAVDNTKRRYNKKGGDEER